MSVTIAGNTIRLEDACRVEDAETLLTALQDHPTAVVDINRCSYLHGAVLQVLLASHCQVTGTCEDAFLRQWVVPEINLGRP